MGVSQMLEKIIEDVSGTKRMYFRRNALGYIRLGLQSQKNNWTDESNVCISNFCMRVHEDYAIFVYSTGTSIYRPFKTEILICEKEAGVAFENEYNLARKKSLDERKRGEEKSKCEDDIY